jgi:hypothetical protein
MRSQPVNRRRIILVIAGIIVASALAFFLQDVVRIAIVNPLAYIWWLLKLAASAIPQLLMWILLVVTSTLILISSLSNWHSGRQKYEKLSRKNLGPVESLSGVITRSKKGNYSKWVLANRLGRILQKWEDKNGKNYDLPSEMNDLRGPNADQTILQYLQAGLDESFVDYPLPQYPFQRRSTTPFDLDVKIAVEYLESRMNHKSKKP